MCQRARTCALTHFHTHIQAQLFIFLNHLVGVFKASLVRPARIERSEGEGEQGNTGVKQVKKLKGMSESVFFGLVVNHSTALKFKTSLD